MKKYFHPKYKHIAFDRNGNVFILENGILKEHPKYINRKGYYDIEIFYRNKRLFKRLHRLMYEAITGKLLKLYRFTKNSKTIDHIDGNKLNNNWKNLQLITLSENVRKYCKERGMHLYEDANNNCIKTNSSDNDVRWMRERNNIIAKKYYKKNKPLMRSYNSEYMKKYFEDPVNYQCHRIRCLIRQVLKNRGERYGKFGEITSKIAPLIADIRPGESISYKIPLYHLIRFNEKLPWKIALDPRNLEIIEGRVDRYNYINDESIRVAKELEVIYKECSGLTAYLKKIQPQYTKKAA